MPKMKIEECIEVVGRINNDLFEGRSEALSASLRVLEAYPQAVEALKKAKSMVDSIPCPQKCDDGVFQVGVGEDEWTQCQWCAEKEEIDQALAAAPGEIGEK